MKDDIGVVQFLWKRELGRHSGKSLTNDLNYMKTGNICEQVIEEKATIPSKNQACEFSGQTRSTFLMAFSPDGSKMASTHGDHAVRITDLTSGKCCHTLKGHPRTPWCVAFHPVSNDILASGCLGGEVRIWDLRGGGSEVWRSEKNMSITSMAFHPSDQVLVFSVANEIHFWDWTQPEPFATATTAFEYEKVRWVRFDPHGYHLYTGIGNGVSVQTEEQQIEHSGAAGGHSSSEARANLQNQYWRILEEINQLRRERLQNEAAGGFTIRRPQPVTPASLAAQAGSLNSSLGQSSGVGRPPSPVHVDALVNARMYASAVTRTQRRLDIPPSTSQDNPVVSAASTQSSSDSHSPNSAPRIIHIGRRVSRTSTASGQGTSILSTAEDSNRTSTIVTPAASSTVSITSDLGSSRSQATTSRLSTFLRSQLTSISGSVPPSLNQVTAASSRMSLAQTASNTLAQSNTIQPVTVIPTPQTSTCTAVSLSSLPTWRPTVSSSSSSLQPRQSSAFQVQSRVSLPSISTIPFSSGGTTSTSSESVRGRFLSYLSSRSNSATSEDHFQCAIGRCQVCQNFPLGMNRWSTAPQSGPIVPRRVSRSTNGRDVPSSSRPKHSSKKLAGLLESEVRQALEQVRARKSDISETLRDLNSLRQEIDTHRCTGPPGEGNNSQDQQSSSSTGNAPDGASVEALLTSELDDELPSSQESILEISEVSMPESQLVNSEEPAATLLVPEVAKELSAIPDPMPLLQPEPGSSTEQSGVPSGQPGSMDLDACSQESSSSSSSLGSLESLPSSQESGETSSSENTLSMIGDYSIEIERRVHDLDQRISDIQSRLQLRLEALQQQRERQQSQRIPLSSVPRCVTVSERIRLRHERLRTHLHDLRRRYQNRIRNNHQERSAEAERSSAESSRRTKERPRRSQRNIDVRRELDRQNHESEAEPAAQVEVPVSVHRPWTSSDRLGGSPRSLRRQVYQSNISNIRADIQRNIQSDRERQRSWHTLQRRHLHPHYAVNILDETVNRPDEGFQTAINRAIAGAFIASGESTVASNIVNSSFRIQRWEFSRGNIPDIKNSKECVIVPQCKLHNDGYCDISQDGRYLAVYVPNQTSYADDSILAIFSLAPETFKQCLFTKSFGPNFVSVSISPLNNYLLVGLATRRLAWVFTPRQVDLGFISLGAVNLKTQCLLVTNPARRVQQLLLRRLCPMASWDGCC